MVSLKSLFSAADKYFSQQEQEEIKKLELQLKSKEDLLKVKETQIITLLDAQTELILKTSALEATNKQYQSELANKVASDALEAHWNDRRPKVSLKYPARPIFGSDKNVEVDPRVFWTPNDCSLITLGGSSNDEKAERCRAWVQRNIKYTTDTDQFKEAECWLYAWETALLGKGDCEDGSILIANLMLKAGIPYWRIRINAGSVSGGGHAWVSYLRESDNTWIICDWCYWPEESKDLKLTWNKAEKHYFSIWFSFNTLYIYKDENYDRG